jgi:DNA-binding FadR family transcriptional regulator
VIADALFHRSILRAADSEFLGALEGAIFSALITSIRLTNADSRKNETSIPFHRAVTDAILARDGDAAEAGMAILLSDAAERLGGKTEHS